MNRPKTSQMVIDEFAKVVDAQDEKGFEKYKESIDEAKDGDYDWNLMAIEEAADLTKYLVRRIIELQKQLVLFDKYASDLVQLELDKHWLTQQLLKAKDKIRELRDKSSFKRYEQLEIENLAMAREIEKLKDDKELFAKLFIKGQLKE